MLSKNLHQSHFKTYFSLWEQINHIKAFLVFLKKKKVHLEDTKLTSHLHCYRKVVLGLWGKEHIYSFLWERLVASWWGSHFNDVQLNGRTVEEKPVKVHIKRKCVQKITIVASQSPSLQPGLWQQSRKGSTLLCCHQSWTGQSLLHGLQWAEKPSCRQSTVAWLPPPGFAEKGNKMVKKSKKKYNRSTLKQICILNAVMNTQNNNGSQYRYLVTWAEMPISSNHFCLASVR